MGTHIYTIGTFASTELVFIVFCGIPCHFVFLFFSLLLSLSLSLSRSFSLSFIRNIHCRYAFRLVWVSCVVPGTFATDV